MSFRKDSLNRLAASKSVQETLEAVQEGGEYNQFTGAKIVEVGDQSDIIEEALEAEGEGWF